MQSKLDELRLLDGLKEHIGWKRLVLIVRERQALYAERLARRIMAGAEVSEKEIAYQRGFIEGALWIIERPEKAAQEFEQAARMAYVRSLGELTTDKEDETPYE